MAIATIILTLLLAAANGANDNAKGVATLAGAGVARYRAAVLWGTFATLAGSLLSLAFASRMSALFTTGIVSAPPSLNFAAAVLLGALAWVGLATALQLPVSTTHAVVGAVIGAGAQLAPGQVHWGVLLGGVALPLLASVVIAWALSAGLNLVHRPGTECTCIEVAPVQVQMVPSSQAAVWQTSSLTLPVIRVVSGTEAECRLHPRQGSRTAITMTGAHWLTSSATSFARGLNDTPKIVAIGTIGLSSARADPRWLLVAVAAAMAGGGLLASARIGRVLGERVVRLGHSEGFRANLIGALLVGAGANLGLPMSTTHVVTGAIAGAAGGDAQRVNRKALKAFALAWSATPAVAAAVSGAAFALLLRLAPA